MSSEEQRAEKCRLDWRLVLPALLPLFFFAWTGWKGIDFGRHWDEVLQQNAVEQAVTNETLLPDFYRYPSVTFALAYASFLPTYWAALEFGPNENVTFDSDTALRELRSDDYLRRTRVLFLLLSSLGLLWVYLYVLRWRGSVASALLAACLLGSSWEVAYHARWIAPDAVMMQFTALCLCLAFTARLPRKGRGWLYGAAVAAGLACGTKYTGGILLLPVLLVAWQRTRGATLRPRLGALLVLSLVFCATYLVTTPGTVLEPIPFWKGVHFEMRHYSIGDYGFSVEGGLEHLGKLLRYLALTLGSPWWPVALALALLAALGAGATWRESRSHFAVLVLLPLAYLLYMSRQNVLFVRNLLFFAPFGALLATRGLGLLTDRVPGHAPRLALHGLAFAAVAANACWLYGAARSIEDRGTDRFLRELHAYVVEEADKQFLVSERLRGELAEAGLVLPANADGHPLEECDLVAIYPADLGKHLHYWPSNEPGLAARVFGPREVNFAWYTTWPEERILLVTPERMRAIQAFDWKPDLPE